MRVGGFTDYVIVMTIVGRQSKRDPLVQHCAVNNYQNCVLLKWVRAADQKPVYNLEWPYIA